MDSYKAKLKEILKCLDEEIEQLEKARDYCNEHANFEAGYESGLRRARTTLEIFFHNDLKKED